MAGRKLGITYPQVVGRGQVPEEEAEKEQSEAPAVERQPGKEVSQKGSSRWGPVHTSSALLGPGY